MEFNQKKCIRILGGTSALLSIVACSESLTDTQVLESINPDPNLIERVSGVWDGSIDEVIATMGNTVTNEIVFTPSADLLLLAQNLSPKLSNGYCLPCLLGLVSIFVHWIKHSIERFVMNTSNLLTHTLNYV